LERVRSIRSGNYSVCDSFNLEDSFLEDCEVDADDFGELNSFGNSKRQIRELKDEVGSLRSQNKKLKKMLLLNMFDSKEDLLEFIEDIW
jgi:hypothetical protein